MPVTTSDENKRRKLANYAADAQASDGANKKTYAELKAELLEKDKEIADLKKENEKLKSQLGSGDDDDISDTEIEELDVSQSWNGKYLQLREYRILNGNCNAPSTKGSSTELLGQWINNQKRAYGNVKSGKKGLKITPERIAMLDALGFHWGKNYPAPQTWEESFTELEKFKKAMGHCKVFIDPKNPSALAKWVSAQRAEYKRFRKGRDTLLSLEQIEQLKGLGFTWKRPSLS